MAFVAIQRAALTVVLLAATMALAFVACYAELQRFERSPKPDASLSLLVVGDWGRNGLFNQSEVATQMGRIGEQLEIDFVISTGDNFYEDGLTGVDDKQFEESFTNIYTAKSLQKQWYSGETETLNHVKFGPRLVSQIAEKKKFLTEIVDFFFVDTTPFHESYWANSTKHHYDWREVAPRGAYISTLLKDLDAALQQSTAPWKIVVGHHTMRSVSEHGDTPELIALLLPVLKSNDVDWYINGHDHCLEHISSKDSPIQYFTSGGGSKAWRGVFTQNSDQLRFFYDGQGFMALKLTRSAADISFYDAFGRVLYQWSASKFLLHPEV